MSDRWTEELEKTRKKLQFYKEKSEQLQKPNQALEKWIEIYSARLQLLEKSNPEKPSLTLESPTEGSFAQ